MNYGERHRHARKLAGLTQVEIAKKSGVKQSTVSKMERGEQVGSKYDIAFATVTGVNPEWLAHGTGAMIPKKYNIDQTLSMDNLTTLYSIPIISMDMAANWDTIERSKQELLKIGTIMVSEKTGENSYAVVQIGDSMQSSYGRTIPDDAKVTIDTSRFPSNGDIVLVDQGKARLLRMLTTEGIDTYLKPLNDKYPIIKMQNDWRIVGVCVAVNTSLI